MIPYHMSDNGYRHLRNAQIAYQDLPEILSLAGSHPNDYSTVYGQSVSKIVSSSSIVSAASYSTQVVASNNAPPSANRAHAESTLAVSGAVLSATCTSTNGAPHKTAPATGYISQPVPIQAVSQHALSAERPQALTTAVVSEAKTVNSKTGTSYS